MTVYLDNLLDQDPRYIIQYIQNMKDNGIDHIRVRFTKNVLDKITILKEYYRSRNDIKIETDFEQAKLDKQLSEMDDRLQQYDYIFDKNLSPTEVLVQYINSQEGNEFWTVDKLEEFLHDIEKL